MKVATNAPRRLTSVLVHSHQNSRGSPETLWLTARRTATTDMDPPMKM